MIVRKFTAKRTSNSYMFIAFDTEICLKYLDSSVAWDTCLNKNITKTPGNL